MLIANGTATGIFGYSKEEFYENGLHLLTDGNWADADKPAFTPIAGAEPVIRHCCRKDGSKIRVLVSTVSFEDGQAAFFLILVELVEAPDSAPYDHHLIDAAISEAPLAVCIMDRQWRVLWSNAMMAKVLGYPASAITQRAIPLRSHIDKRYSKKLEQIDQALRLSGRWRGKLVARRTSGKIYPLYGSFVQVRGINEYHNRIIATFTNVARFPEYARKLANMGSRDPVTGLPSRFAFEQAASEVLGRANPARSHWSLMLLDIDGFRAVNETLGYESADLVLRHLAARLRRLTPKESILSRLPGNFALLTTGGAEEAALLADSIRRVLAKPIERDGNQFSLTASMGISCYPEDGNTLGALLKCAESALHQAKSFSGDNYAFYQKGQEEKSQRFLRLASPMREALARGEFVAYFQPIVHAGTRKIVAMETLARWHREDGTIVSPNDFIPVAERSGLIGDLSETMLRQACQYLNTIWQQQGLRLCASINLSPRQFREKDLPSRLLQVMNEEPIDPRQIYLEITENVLMEGPEEKSRMLAGLREEGVRIVIDDFGTGYSSFAYLKHFAVDGIKLDRLFVNGIPGEDKDERLVAMMLAIGRELNIPVVAEGVESQDQADFLVSRGCRRLQGFFFSRPVPAAEFTKLLI